MNLKITKPGWFVTAGGLEAHVTIVDKALRRLYGAVHYSDMKFVTTNWEMDGSWVDKLTPHEFDIVKPSERKDV